MVLHVIYVDTWFIGLEELKELYSMTETVLILFLSLEGIKGIVGLCPEVLNKRMTKGFGLCLTVF